MTLNRQYIHQARRARLRKYFALSGKEKREAGRAEADIYTHLITVPSLIRDTNQSQISTKSNQESAKPEFLTKMQLRGPGLLHLFQSSFYSIWETPCTHSKSFNRSKHAVIEHLICLSKVINYSTGHFLKFWETR